MSGIRLLPLFVFICTMTSSSVDQKIITAESGQEKVALTCRASNNTTINIVEWSRADLGEKYVLSYRDGRFLSDHQHPSFKNRVDLQDRQMKDGNVSLILNNLTSADSGTYVCRVFLEETQSWDDSSITLRVVPPGQPRGLTGDGGKEAGGKEAGGKEAGGKEAGGKEAGGKEAGVRGHLALVAGLLVVVFVPAAIVLTIKLIKKARLCPACDEEQLV